MCPQDSLLRQFIDLGQSAGIVKTMIITLSALLLASAAGIAYSKAVIHRNLLSTEKFNLCTYMPLGSVTKQADGESWDENNATFLVGDVISSALDGRAATLVEMTWHPS